MNGHCDFHTFERAVDVCGLCYGDLCRNCALKMKGRRDAVCKDCALTVSGIRGAGKTEVRGDRSTVKKRRKAYAAAGPSDDYFKYFDEGRDDLEVTFGDKSPSSDEAPPPPNAEATQPSSPTDLAGDEEHAKSDESGLRRFIGKRKPAPVSAEEQGVEDFIAINEMLGGSDADGGGPSAHDQDAVSQLADIRNRDRERDPDADGEVGLDDLADSTDDGRDQANETLPSPISKAEAWAAGFEEVGEPEELDSSSQPAPVDNTDRERPAESAPSTAMTTSTFDDRYDEELIDTSIDPFAAKQAESHVDQRSEPVQSIPVAESTPAAETPAPIDDGQRVSEHAVADAAEPAMAEVVDTAAEVPAAGDSAERSEVPDSERADPELRKMADVSSEPMGPDDATDSVHRSTDVFNFDVSPRLKGLADELAAKRDDGPIDSGDNPFARRSERQPVTAAPDFTADPFAQPPEPEPAPLPKRRTTEAESIEPEVDAEAVDRHAVEIEEVDAVAVEEVVVPQDPVEKVVVPQDPVEKVVAAEVPVEEVEVEVESSAVGEGAATEANPDEAVDEWGWVHDEPLETLVDPQPTPEHDEPVRPDPTPVPDGPDPVYSDDDHPNRRRDDTMPAPSPSPASPALSPEQFAKASHSDEMMATALGDARDEAAEVDGDPPELGSTVMPTLEEESDGWIEVDDVPDLEGTTARQRADVDARGSWIPPALRGVAEDAAEAGQDLPRRRREGE